MALLSDTGSLPFGNKTSSCSVIALISFFLFLFLFSSDDPDREGMLSPEEYWAIILSLAISLFLAISIAFFLWRGNRRIKKARKEAKEQRTSHRSRNNHVGAEVGNADDVCSVRPMNP